MKTQPHDPANPFPHVNQDGTVQYDANTGLTKREMFAATLRNDFESLPVYVQETICGENAPSYEIENLDGYKETYRSYGEPYVKWLLKGKARYAVMQADALIEALNREVQNG